jgi:hypothetical protein
VAVLLFRLSQVPDDEAHDVRTLLSEHDIHFYETDAGFFRVGVEAIWLASSEQEERARELIQAYQQERAQSQRASFIELAEAGSLPSFWQRFGQSPLRMIATYVAVIFVAGLTLIPFLMLLR